MGHAAQRPEIVWSAARAERERAAAEVGHDGLHLTRAQKWDLVRICAAALASAAFFSAPFLLSSGPSPVQESAIQVPAIPIEQTVSVHETLDRISVVTTDLVVPAEGVLIQAVHQPTRRAPRSGTVRASYAPLPVAPARSNDRSLARRLGRALAGDGRHTVRPFPSLDSNQ
jgi:hypothetical protein